MPATVPEVITEKDSPSPVIVDLGRWKRSAIKELCRGEGELVGEVQGCIEEFRRSGVISGSVQPIVVIIREKRKSKPLLWPSL